MEKGQTIGKEEESYFFNINLYTNFIKTRIGTYFTIRTYTFLLELTPAPKPLSFRPTKLEVFMETSNSKSVLSLVIKTPMVGKTPGFGKT